jgi:hypothetical protein
VSNFATVIPPVTGYDYVQTGAPSDPDIGETWFDSDDTVGKVWAGGSWIEESAPKAGTALNLSGGSYHVSGVGESELSFDPTDLRWTKDGSINVIGAVGPSYSLNGTYDQVLAVVDEWRNTSGSQSSNFGVRVNGDAGNNYEVAAGFGSSVEDAPAAIIGAPFDKFGYHGTIWVSGGWTSYANSGCTINHTGLTGSDPGSRKYSRGSNTTVASPLESIQFVTGGGVCDLKAEVFGR